MRNERKSFPSPHETAGLQKAFTKSFLKISKKVVDRAVTKEYVYERRKKRRE